MLQRIKPLPVLALAAHLLVLLGIVLAIAASAAAQNIQNPQSAVDSLTRRGLRIDPSTGALQMQIPLGEYRGRGEASLPVVLNYSSKLWNIKYISTAACSGEPVSAYRGDHSKGSASGWTSTLGWFLPPQDVTLETYEGLYQKPAQRGDPTLWRIARVYVTLPDGSRHELRRDDNLHSTTENLTGVYYAVDGSRLWYDKGTDILYLPNGARYLNVSGGAVQYVDRNGNTLSYDSSSGLWSDTLGRNIGVPVAGAAPAVGNYSYALPGVDGSTVTYTMHWSNLGDALSDPNQPLHYIGDSLSANCTTGNHQPNNLFSTIDDQNKVMQGGIFNPVVLSQIVLPNGASYTFTYNVYGEIDKIVYPTGGSEQFGYAMLAPLGGQLDDGTYSQANRGVTSRVISDGATTQTWQYNSGNNFDTGVDPATAARWVVSPDGTVTKTWYYKSRGTDIHYGFDDARTGMAREERVYNSAGTMIRRTLFQLTEDGPQSGGYSTATRNARVIKKVDIILDTGGNALAAATEMTYDSDLNVTVTKHYDYASIAQTTAQTADTPSIPNGTLLRTEETDYLTGDANYRARNLLSLPTAARVKDGAGNVVAQSSFAYDETALQNIGSANGWNDPQTSYRGNPTTSSHWLNTTNSYLGTHASYDQFGNVRTTTDAQRQSIANRLFRDVQLCLSHDGHFGCSRSYGTAWLDDGAGHLERLRPKHRPDYFSHGRKQHYHDVRLQRCFRSAHAHGEGFRHCGPKPDHDWL
jgi:hypothetical protein